MYIRNHLYELCIFLACIIACKETDPKKIQPAIAIEDHASNTEVKVRQIFYNIYMPSEMSRIFERSGANYSPHILNSPDNYARYSSPHQIALNLGLYGVDMSYTKLFDQVTSTAKYLSTIQILSEKLEIPNTYFQDILKAFEQYRDNKDSLTRLAGEIYQRSDRFLKENQKEPFAALILMGGWIEALYIACKIIEAHPHNVEMMEKIGEQKYSLNILISLLSNYQDDLDINENILMLKQLKKSFDKIEIFYNQASFKIDTVNDLISASEYFVDITPESVSEISSMITRIRMRIVN